MATRTTFIWYLDRLDYAKSMSNEELWMLFRKILQHENQIEEIDLPLEFKFTRLKIQTKLDENLGKWNKKVKARSEAWKNHVGNQYTRGDKKRNGNDKAQKKIVEQMEQMEQNGTISWYNTNTISSSMKKEERNKKKEEMLEAYRMHPKINTTYKEEDVEMWLDYKIDRKQPYKNARSFCTYLVSVKKEISFWQVRLDLDKRFSYAVDIAIATGRDGIHWYDRMERNYLMAKKDLYPNPKQNE